MHQEEKLMSATSIPRALSSIFNFAPQRHDYFSHIQRPVPDRLSAAWKRTGQQMHQAINTYAERHDQQRLTDTQQPGSGK